MSPSYITGSLITTVGEVPVVADSLSISDLLGTMKTRWGIGRNSYRVKPGLYATGKPDENSRVFVTGNYKLSFDHLRNALHSADAWLLVLDTRGINVWCAAGKGTFGTKELVAKIGQTGLDKLVSHRRLILPQLGATGVSAHEVRKQTGFSVTYGPIRADDIPAFLQNGLKASREMRTVKFGTWERMKLIPNELSYGSYYIFLVPAAFFILAGLNPSGYSFEMAFTGGLRALINLLTAYLSGIVITPMLLPWIPFRRFSLKGILISLFTTFMLVYLRVTGNNILEIISWFLMNAGLASFLAMNFTGSSTFTSLSGVQKEMKTALPMQITMAGLGLILWILSKFVSI